MNLTAVPQVPAEVRSIHERAIRAADTFRKSEVELIRVLQEADLNRVYLHYGSPSLFAYANRVLKLSEAVSGNFITVARKAAQVPALMAAIVSGGLEVNKARKVCPMLVPEDGRENILVSLVGKPESTGFLAPPSSSVPAAGHSAVRVSNQDWVEKAQLLSARAVEQAVAQKAPILGTREMKTFLGNGRVKVQVPVSEALMDRLEQARDQVSRSHSKAATLEETLEELTEFYLKRKDPLEQAKRARERSEKKAKRTEKNERDVGCATSPPEPVTGHVVPASEDPGPVMGRTISDCSAPEQVTGPMISGAPEQIAGSLNLYASPRGKRSSPPAHVLHEVRVRDDGQCVERMPDGSRCPDRRWLHAHHRQQVSQGGKDTVENLELLCAGHHRARHLGRDDR